MCDLWELGVKWRTPQTDSENTEGEAVGWAGQDNGQNASCIDTARNVRVSQKAGNFVTSCATTGLLGFQILTAAIMKMTCLVGCSAVQAAMSLPTFQGSVLPPSTGSYFRIHFYFHRTCNYLYYYYYYYAVWAYAQICIPVVMTTVTTAHEYCRWSRSLNCARGGGLPAWITQILRRLPWKTAPKSSRNAPLTQGEFNTDCALLGLRGDSASMWVYG
jgi:hypothetical protein